MNTKYLQFKKNIQIISCFVCLCFLLPSKIQAQLDCAKTTVTPTPAICTGQGAINITLLPGFGGTAPYTYAWSPTQSQSSMPINNLSAGTYNITITDPDPNNAPCVITNIVIPNTYTPMQTPIPSWSGCQASVTIVGGKAPYTIDVIPSSPLISTTTSNTTYTFSNLSNGSKAIKITDACGQTVTTASGLVNYIPMGVSAVFVPPAPGGVSATVTSPTNSQYTYDLYIDGLKTQTIKSTSKTITFPDVTPACTGNYVTVTDSTCGDTKTAQITIPNETPEIKVDCVNFKNGTAALSATKGKAPYVFEVYNNTLTTKLSFPFTATSVIFKVIDACGKFQFSGVYSNPTLQIFSAVPDCANSKVTLNGQVWSNGTAPVPAPVFLPLTFTNLNPSPYTSTSTTATFTKNDIPTNFVLNIKDECNNNYTIKDTIKFDFALNQPCKAIKVGPITYQVKYVNGALIHSSPFTAPPGTTYELYNDIPLLVTSNNTGIFTNLNYDKDYTVKIVTPCGLTTSKTIKLPAPTGGPSPSVSYLCVNNILKGKIDSTGLTPPMSVVLYPSGVKVKFNDTLVLGQYLVEDCTGKKIVDLLVGPPPTEVSYTKKDTCVNNTFKHTIIGGNNNLGSGPYTLWDNAIPRNLMPSKDNKGKIFENLPAGTYYLTSAVQCTKETKIVLVDPPKKIINVTIEGPFCNGDKFYWNIKGINSFFPSNFILKHCVSGVPLAPSTPTGSAFENVEAGEYCLSGECTEEKKITLVNPIPATIPFAVFLECKNKKLVYKVVVTNTYLKPFKLNGGAIPSEYNDGYTFIDLAPGTYTLSGGCSEATTVVLPNFPAMPPVKVTLTGNCPTNTFLKAETDDIGAIWSNWLVGKTITIPPYFTACGGGATFKLSVIGGSPSFNPNSTTCTGGKFTAEFKQIPAGDYELELSSCAYTDKVSVKIPPHIQPVVAVTREVVCTPTDKADIKISVQSNSYPIKIEWMTCGLNPTVKDVLVQNYNDPTFIHKNLPIGAYCYRITDVCDFSESGTSAVALLGNIRPNYRDSCGYIVLYMDKLLGATYKWTLLPNTTVLSTSEKLIVKAETFDREFKVEVSLPNNTVCTRIIKIKANSGLSPIPLIQDKTKVTTCEANGKIPLSFIIVNGVPDEFLTKIEWLAADKETVLATGKTFEPNKTGKYYVKITNDSMNLKCRITYDSVKIIVPTAKLDADIIKKNVTCFQFKNGTIDIAAKGGIKPYTYKWSTTSTDTKLTNLNIGIYTCTITDSIGCTSIHAVTITEPELLTVTVKQKNQNNCDAKWEIITNGGTKPYNVIIDNNAPIVTSTNIIECVLDGKHIIKVIDANGCEAVKDSFFYKKDFPLTKQKINICYGTKFKIDLGFGKFVEYDKTGVYTDTITTSDASCGKCKTQLITNLTVLQPVVVTANLSSNTLCEGGEVKVWASATGGIDAIHPYTFKKYNFIWSNGQQGTDVLMFNSAYFNVLGNASPALLKVIVKDSLGCEGTADVGTITYIKKFSAAIYSDDKCIVPGCNRTAYASPNFGDYTYKWSNGKTTSAIDSLCQNKVYTVTITDKYSCNTIVSKELDAIPIPTFILILKNKKEICAGSNEKRRVLFDIYYVNSPDIPSLKFQMNGVPTIFPYDNSINYFYVELPVGKHKIKMITKDGCIDEKEIEIKGYPAMKTAVAQKDSLCFGSSITLNAIANPTAKVKDYTWYNAGDWKMIGVSNAPLQVLNTTNLFLVQSDNNGCRDTVKYTVNAFDNPKAEITGDKTICDGDKGKLTAKLNNSIANHKYSYKWTINGVVSVKDTSETIEITKTGEYKVVITDLITKCNSVLIDSVKSPKNSVYQIKKDVTLCENGKTTLDSGVGSGGVVKWYKDGKLLPWTTEKITVSEPGDYYVEFSKGSCSGKSGIFPLKMLPNPTLTLESDVIICKDKTTTLSPKSPNSPLKYKWSNNLYTPTIDAKVGSYSVIATDVNGCFATASVNVKEYDALKAEIIKPKKMCPNDSTTLSLTTTYVSYVWSDGSKASTLKTNKEGTYSVTVTNDKGCTALAEMTIEKAIPSVPVLKADTVCYNAKGTVAITNAVEFDKYTWNNNTTNASTSFEKVDTFKVKTIDKNSCPSEASITTAMFPKPTVTPIVPKICQGLKGNISLKEPFKKYLWDDTSTDSTLSVNTTKTYYVTLTDKNGCTAETFAAVTILPNPKPVLNAPDAVCVGDAVTLEVDKKDFAKYVWSSNTSQTFTATYPTVGTYTVTVTDSNACVGVVSKTVITADGLKVGKDTIKACYGKKVTLSRGKYDTYLWSNTAKTQTIDVTVPGTYTVSVSIGNCTGVGSVTVEYFDLPTPKITAKDKPCFGKTTTLTVNYGENVWSTSEINQLSVEKPKGDYIVTVTNANGCTAKAAITVTEFDKLIPETVSGKGCEGTKVTVGLKNPYPTITWDTGEKTQTIQVTKAGTYTVTVTDSNGCEGENFATATVNPLPKVICQATKTPVCPDEKTTILANSPTAVSYLWSNAATIKSQISGKGSYYVTVTDVNDCKASDTIVITEFKPIAVTLEVENLKLCAKDSSTITLTFNGLDGKKATVTLADGSRFLVIKNVTKDTTFAYKPNSDKTLSIQTISVEGYDCNIGFDKNIKFEIKVSQLKAAITSANPKCYGTKNGFVSLTSNGNTVQWSEPSFASNKEIKNLVKGNYTVTVSDDLGCSLTLSTSISEPNPIDMTVTTTKTCVGMKNASAEIKANGGAGSLIYYFNNLPYNDGKMPNLAKGTYTAMVKDKNGCTSKTENVKIENYPKTEVRLYAGDTTSIVKGYDSLRVQILIDIDGRRVDDVSKEGFLQYDIKPYPCQNCLSFFAKTDSATTYKVNLIDKNGCPASDKIRIGVEELVKEVDYPNAVTDGNPFKVLNPNRSVRKFNALRVFDRWGNMVYQELNFKPSAQIGWDGTFRGSKVEPGVYVWIAVAEFLDGSTKLFKGDITVVGTAD